MTGIEVGARVEIYFVDVGKSSNATLLAWQDGGVVVQLDNSTIVYYPAHALDCVELSRVQANS